jgi:antitoxin YefM
MTAVTIADARENLIGLVRHVCEDHVAIEIVAHGGNAVLMSAEDYGSMRETLYLFSTPANGLAILGAMAEMRAGGGRVFTPEELAGRFGIDMEGEPS